MKRQGSVFNGSRINCCIFLIQELVKISQIYLIESKMHSLHKATKQIREAQEA